MPIVTVIGGVARNGVVGYENGIPWTKEQVPRDLPHFARQTTGGAMIMGKQTFLSMGILKNRLTIVVSKTLQPVDGITVVSTYQEALDVALAAAAGKEDFPISAIGGHGIWKEALEHPLTNRAMITRIDGEFEGDTFFPEEALQNNFWLFYKDNWKEKDEGKISSIIQLWKRN